jgi:uncharacterized protein
MTQTTSGAPKPVWIDLASADPAAAGAFYSGLFGWDVTVNPDPQYGGYALATLDGKAVAGIGPKQSPAMPSAWSLYLGTSDADAVVTHILAAGGTVVAPPFPVGDQGRMAVFQDNVGAFISTWQPAAMAGFEAAGPGTFAWAELSARGLDRAVAFYETAFGWKTHATEMPDGSEYIEFLAGDQSIAGAQEVPAMVPAEMPSYWLAYFGVADVDAAYGTALELGGHEMLPPRDFAGGRFAIVSDPEGAAFGLLKMSEGA